MLVKMTLQVVVNVAFQCGRSGIAEDSDSNLATAIVPPFRVDEDLDVTGASVTGHDARNFQIGGRFARGLDGDLRDGTNSDSVF